MSGEEQAKTAEVADRIGLLKDLEDPWYPVRLNEIVFAPGVTNDILFAIARSTSFHSATRFGAVYGLLNRVRRFRDLADYEPIYNEFRPIMLENAWNKVLQSQVHLIRLQRNVGLDDEGRLALEDSLEAKRLRPNDFSVLSHYVSTVATVAELRQNIPMDVLQQAAEDQRRAISLCGDHYARYHNTLGRILLLLGDPTGAIREAELAAEREKSTTSDYPVRLGMYDALRNQASLRLMADNLRTELSNEISLAAAKLEDFQVEIVASRTATLAVTGVLAGVLALITGAAGILHDAGPRQAAGLLGALSGAVILVFATFFALANARSPRNRVLGVLMAGVTGAILIVAGAWFTSL